MELTTQRLVLRLLRPDDREFFTSLFNHPELRRRQDKPAAPEHLPNIFQNCLKASPLEAPYLCLVINTKEETAIGLIFLSIVEGQSQGMRGQGRQLGSLGMVLVPSAQNQGFATEACEAVVAFCFQKRKLPAMVMGCYASNPASRRVIEKLGFSSIPFSLRASRVLTGEAGPSELWHELTYRDWLKHRIALLEHRLASANT